MNKDNKKVLAEKLKKHLNSSEYVAIPDLISINDCSPGLTSYDGEHILKTKKFIDFGKELDLIYYDQLEPTDWAEIISLIKTRNAEREKNYEAKKKKIEDKVNSQPGLFYYYGSGSKNERSNSTIDYGDKKGRYFGLWGSENGRSFYLKINSQHPVLDNFPFGKHGYYLIETDKPIERNDGIVRPWSDGGETNPSNFYKWVEVGDQITITPHETAEKSIENNQPADERNDNHNEPAKEISAVEEKKFIKWLVKYFQEKSIKEISMDDDNLIITHNNNNNNNNNETVSASNRNHEQNIIENYLAKENKNSLKLKELEKLLNNSNTSQNSAPNSPKTDYTPYMIGGAILIGLTFIVAVSYYLGKKRGKKNIE